MLLQLRIASFAVIDECLVDFEQGFVAVTGETGAGKSILIDALGGCLGARLGSDVVRSGTEKAEMEAVFAWPQSNPELEDLLTEVGVEHADVLILARDVGRGGRSLGRINGRAVPLATLSAIGVNLVDIHGQSEHLSLLKPARQLDMLDHFGDLDSHRKGVAHAVRHVIDSRARLAELESNRRSSEQRLDFLRYQIAEIVSADLSPGEVAELTEERIRLANAEKLAMLATDALSALDADDGQSSAAEHMTTASTALRQLAAIDIGANLTFESAEELLYGIRDLAAALREYRDAIEFSPARLDEVESRLDVINRLCRKYGDTVEDVLSALEAARTELDQVENYEARLAEALELNRSAEADAGRLAVDLSDRRTRVKAQFVEQVRERLSRLGLGPASFEIELLRTPSAAGIRLSNDGNDRFAFTSTGVDHIQFLVSFNAGEPLRPIEKVASGGETARFVLAVKAVLASADDVPTLIFDEIDTGLGGRSGGVVAAMMEELAGSHQVVSITHLPQIAAKASQHLKVLKWQDGESTKTGVRRVDGDERVTELAEMLGGTPVSAAAQQAAQELLRGWESSTRHPAVST
jgi:DNA repair protein RecN (Recombination protein N)